MGRRYVVRLTCGRSPVRSPLKSFYFSNFFRQVFSENQSFEPCPIAKYLRFSVLRFESRAFRILNNFFQLMEGQFCLDQKSGRSFRGLNPGMAPQVCYVLNWHFQDQNRWLIQPISGTTEDTMKSFWDDLLLYIRWKKIMRQGGTVR